mmetsp:Transcript_24659/g.68985  ORF Transcript_24659/g.68985 Transcript_24659/m.68985 type:complete len:204 (-) Transcript_24659:596-1207(-)
MRRPHGVPVVLAARVVVAPVPQAEYTLIPHFLALVPHVGEVAEPGLQRHRCQVRRLGERVPAVREVSMVLRGAEIVLRVHPAVPVVLPVVPDAERDARPVVDQPLARQPRGLLEPRDEVARAGAARRARLGLLALPTGGPPPLAADQGHPRRFWVATEPLPQLRPRAHHVLGDRPSVRVRGDAVEQLHEPMVDTNHDEIYVET